MKIEHERLGHVLVVVRLLPSVSLKQARGMCMAMIECVLDAAALVRVL
jgi:hypothetical protein